MTLTQTKRLVFCGFLNKYLLFLHPLDQLQCINQDCANCSVVCETPQGYSVVTNHDKTLDRHFYLDCANRLVELLAELFSS